jgi:phage I-like protein
MSGSFIEIVHTACRVAIPVEAPDRVMLVPWGQVRRTDGSSFTIDEAAAASIMEHFAKRSTEIPFDYEHHTIGGKYAAPDGKAVAAGWIKELFAIPGEGIFATVEWTRGAATHIQEKEYRYVSPAFGVLKNDGTVVFLDSAALTNTPAIEKMRPLVNKGDAMPEKLESLRWFLNLDATATQELIMEKMDEFIRQLREELDADETTDQAGIVSSVKARLTEANKLRTAVCKSVGLDAAKVESPEEIVAAINAFKASAKTVPAGDAVPKAEYDVVVASHNKLAEQVEALSKLVNYSEVEKRLKQADDEGKLTDDMLKLDANGRNHFRDLATRPEEWNAWLERTAVVKPKSGRVISPNARPAGPGGHRGQIIATAKAEFADNESKIACTRAAYVNECLRELGQEPLTESEATNLAA